MAPNETYSDCIIRLAEPNAPRFLWNQYPIGHKLVVHGTRVETARLNRAAFMWYKRFRDHRTSSYTHDDDQNLGVVTILKR